ncbi:hypothetical protein [Streptomyces nanshensis]|uniref:hypothetical protein n=1 Tax=Streptomyces nanshensis TaxID=518642 RepID=UPI001495D0AE|nr:hypothetical protein [Streptomyces nanshensis]
MAYHVRVDTNDGYRNYFCHTETAAEAEKEATEWAEADGETPQGAHATPGY